ncbi:hypothetical protein F2Q68_00034356 [Brassica cretica]|uniref:Uncharacterized protein n=2 Tax=Brassica cretica TaxID=69181 RepID=A0ABQ7E6Z7_BRACR|nr:hypothetical protein F2Q68_00034356 [Brassica cretica]KAF3592606.1 hypothetical protein DY000_02022134 [Brassica cretica]
MEEMKQDIAMMQTHRPAEVTTPASIDGNIPPSIDEELTPSNPIKSEPTTYTRAEIDELVEEIYRTLGATEDRLDKRCDDMCTTISTNRFRRKSIDDVPTQYRGKLVTKVTSVDKSDTNNHGQDISDHTYAKLVRHQFNNECLEERLQNLANTTATMKDKWKRGDEAMRSLIDPSRRLPRISTTESMSISIDSSSPAATDVNSIPSIDT